MCHGHQSQCGWQISNLAPPTFEIALSVLCPSKTQEVTFDDTRNETPPD